LNGVVISATIILVIIASVIAFLLYLGTHSVNGLGIVLSRGAHIINKSLWPFIHRDYLSEDRAKLFAQDASGGLLALRQKPNGVIIPFALALSSKALLVVILLLMFLAFNIPPTPGTIIAAFSLGYLFLIVSPTPAGIGFVEGGMTLALSSLGLTLGASAVVALAYRGVTFWIPLVIGMLSFRYLTNAKEIEPIT
jgi:uncharacterized protein (TIRG00374 family)